MIRNGDGEADRDRSTKETQFVGSTKGVIKEVEKENYKVQFVF